MSTWLWVIVATFAFVVVPAAVSLAVAAFLGVFSRREEAELLEAEHWTVASLRREEADDEDEAPAVPPLPPERVGRTR